MSDSMKKMLITVVLLIVTTLISYLYSWFTSCWSSTKFFSSMSLNSYEMQISKCAVDPEDINTKMSDIGGLASVKKDLEANVLLPMKYPHIFYQKTSLHPGPGILLYGPPGTGKTLLARSIASECNAVFISLSLSNLENKYYGETNKLISAAFSYAKIKQPSIIFLDEIDGLLRHRSENDQNCVYGFKTELLNLIDGISSKQTDAVMVIGCTNNPHTLDSALKRRLPRQYKIDLPTINERFDILNIITSADNIPKHDLKSISMITPGFSGSDLMNCFKKAGSIRLTQQKTEAFVNSLDHIQNVSDLVLNNITLDNWIDAVKSMLPEEETNSNNGDEAVPP